MQWDLGLECIRCPAIVNVSSGFTRLMQHFKSTKHRESMGGVRSQCTIQYKTLTSAARNSNNQTEVPTERAAIPTIHLFHPRDAASRAEIIWSIETVKDKNSLRSCNDKKNVFECMFPGAVPQGFSSSSTKLHYLLTEAIGPY